MKPLSGFKKKGRIPLSAVGLLLLLYFFFIIRFHFRYELQIQTYTPLNIAIIISGFLTLFIVARTADIMTGQTRLLKGAANSVLIVLYLTLSIYHMRSHIILDYAVTADNASLAFHKESLKLISRIPERGDYILAGAILAAMILLQWKWRVLTTPQESSRPRLKLLLMLSGYLLCLHFLPYTYDEITSFAQSAYRYYFTPPLQFQVPDPGERYPYVRKIANEKRKDPPHVFIIMVESFNANFVNSKTPEGSQYTPFFNTLTREGLYFDNFWGNSMQTAKGQLSELCSVIPLTRQKVFTRYPDLDLHCLPQIMEENGYETFYFQGYPDLTFDNTGAFMEKNGFMHVNAMDESFVSEDERRRYQGDWGVQDDILYRKTFRYMDEISKTRLTQDKKPKYFVVIATITNHMRFNEVPESQRYLYPKQKTRKQYYANSLRVTDEYLKAFFEELRKRDYLKNSVVIITGDHGFPVGEHGYYDSESGFYNEYFKTPLLILGKGISSSVVHEPHSQLDIAPTVLELAGISAVVHFKGESVFSKAPSSIPIVQPYAGNSLGVISYPYKYIYNRRFQQEYLFDLVNDPLEKRNIIATIYSKPLYGSFHRGVGEILLNDRLIKENRIWKNGN